MGTTYLHAVASLDGYIADDDDAVGPLHDWYFNGDQPLVEEDHPDVHAAPFRVSAASVERGSRAQELAGEGEIGMGAGNVGGQALSLGLIDHVAIDIVPVVFGRGKPYFRTIPDGRVLLEDPDVVIQGDGVLHVRYPVRRDGGRSGR
jgi:hypothetical protein